ncbi:hypothetical protein vBDshSR4C_036 [Dinoroseobacter phage vB_DshS-R4C]|nr:hypothetical protein vBDshSR4C_036 [Dinoroseobacter phage vB_DshS-R4C]
MDRATATRRLRFLCAVERQRKNFATLSDLSDIPPADIGPTVAREIEAGHIETTGNIHPPLRLTRAGVEFLTATAAALGAELNAEKAGGAA